MQRRLGTGAEDSEHADEMPAPRVFPDPSTFRSRQFEDRGTLQGDRVHDRTILRKDTVRESAAAPHTLLPPAPKQVAAARRESQISNLLIDLDDAPAPPPSPQLSNSSSNSVGSCDTHVPSSHTSASAPSSRAMSPIKVGESSHAVECHTGPAAPKMQHEGKDHPGQALSRRFSLRSWASVSEEDVKPAKPLTMRKIASRRYTRQPNAATKQPGLATSKHAAGYNRNKNVESHAKNANRRVALQKGFEVGGTELHAKIDQLRRAPHQKERARKGTAGVDRQACAVPSENVTVNKHGEQTAPTCGAMCTSACAHVMVEYTQLWPLVYHPHWIGWHISFVLDLWFSHGFGSCLLFLPTLISLDFSTCVRIAACSFSFGSSIWRCVVTVGSVKTIQSTLLSHFSSLGC
jgi:hypothetical protein